MFFIKELEKYKDKKINLYVDMDGVIAYYNLDNPYNYKIKRPLLSNIKQFEIISKMSNIQLHILSICKSYDDIKDKNDWLDKFAPFFKKEYRKIIPHNDYLDKSSAKLKSEYLKKTLDDNYITMMIDDDIRVIKLLQKDNPNVVIYQDSVLID